MSVTAEPAPCRLYLVTPERLEPTAFADQLAAALDGGDVASVQLRLKNVDDDTIKRACEILLPVATTRDVAFLLNDRPDLAVACGCDGVHVGQSDTPYAEARQKVGADRIVGVTCHDSRHMAMVAAEAGADYVAFGAFYPTQTKPSHYRPQPDLLQWWSEFMTVPSVAIGGITPGNCAPLVQAGADFIAVVSAVWQHPDGPGAAVKAFNQAIAAARG
ncbi:thiamine-phosphate synthase [Aliidongia dinghuensis]|uniref:Thiamine-phosphate synthase n=1 Tax=Aliidongia dinghuensis TaxID=1867774 RepID=A0A8J3E3I4_9PROT|nr:thiamine phosphate synthase [Aliidongia dinghuensis]GGF16710.1 thiamine-phosphate synthase [Aliidongia dinghuensis]